MKRKILLLLGAALLASSLTSCYTYPAYWGGTVGVSTYRPYYARGHAPYYRSYRYSPRSYGYPSRSYSYHPHHHGRPGFPGSPGHHHHHH